MENKELYRPLEVCVSDMEHWDRRPLVYHFFEIVQILEGSGVRRTNLNDFPYEKGSIFLFTPVDCRGFKALTPTRFCSIRFSEVFLGQYKSETDRARIVQWLKQLEHIFSHHNRFQQLLVKDAGDCKLITSLINNVVQEYEQKQAYHEENLQHLITLLLNILARNAADHTAATTGPDTEPLINRMLLHVRQHISDAEKLRVDYLAAHFNLSANYVGEYFRKLTGESLQHYITQYKINMVQQRLAFSTLTISQIAGELGFTDESHLGRQFRKHSGVSPLEYRKNARLVGS
ncbi:AraC family transcriptional regulator [Chitinophaga sp.]|uniref:AraC family transcriptional regulator n=1 Tax=Chitinophaga sp. TaxID=1869181 RepID=UPI002F93C421